MKIVCNKQSDHRWLVYTLETIREMAKIDLDFSLLDQTLYSLADDISLCYGVPPLNEQDIFIPRQDDWDDRSKKMVFKTLDCGEDGLLAALIYQSTVSSSPLSGPGFDFDIFFNIFAYIACLEEYHHEKTNGPVHSYAYRLKGDGRRFDRPYANILILHFCEQLKRYKVPDQPKKQGSPVLHLTHDLDAIKKSSMIRAKQGALSLYSTLRSLLDGDLAGGGRKFLRLAAFLGRKSNYWHFEEIMQLEQTHDVSSSYLIYAQTKPANLLGWLSQKIFDPEYDISEEERLKQTLKKLEDSGSRLGLHTSFTSWNDSDQMRLEKETLERTLDRATISFCRQHWLRFSLAETWQAQEDAGLTTDATLGFNDRHGFRAGLACSFHPYNHTTGKKHRIRAIPMVLMDRHLFDYGLFSEEERLQTVHDILNDLCLACGEASIIWHPHVWSEDFKWSSVYQELLAVMKKNGITCGRAGDRQPHP